MAKQVLGKNQLTFRLCPWAPSLTLVMRKGSIDVMNIFYLDENPALCAAYHCDKHAIKMLLETAQLLCSAHHVCGTPTPEMYRLTHKNHPVACWVRASKHNYDWTYRLFKCLATEYNVRYNKTHRSWQKLHQVLELPPANIPDITWQEPPQCMPEKYRQHSTVEAYRDYYVAEKSNFCKWKNGMEIGLADWFNPRLEKLNMVALA